MPAEELDAVGDERHIVPQERLPEEVILDVDSELTLDPRLLERLGCSGQSKSVSGTRRVIGKAAVGDREETAVGHLPDAVVHVPGDVGLDGQLLAVIPLGVRDEL